MVDFIDRHRDQYGVEPICAQLPIAPSQYYEHKARQADPERRPPRVRRDEALLPEIRRFAVSTRRTSASTAHARCGVNSAASRSPSRAARSSG